MHRASIVLQQMVLGGEIRAYRAVFCLLGDVRGDPIGIISFPANDGRFPCPPFGTKSNAFCIEGRNGFGYGGDRIGGLDFWATMMVHKALLGTHQLIDLSAFLAA